MPANQYDALIAAGWTDTEILNQFGPNSPEGRIAALTLQYQSMPVQDNGYRYQFPTAPAPAPAPEPRRERGFAQSGAPGLMTDPSALMTAPQQPVAAPAPDAYYQPAPQPQPSLALTPDAFSGPGVVRGPISREYHYPIEQEVRGPIQQEVRGPIEQEIRGPISREYHYPIEQEVRGPIEQELRGPISREYHYPVEQVWQGDITPPSYLEGPGLAAGYQPTSAEVAAVEGARDYITRLRNAVAGGLSFDRSTAYAPDPSMLPDPAVAPQWPSVDLGAAADYLGNAVAGGLQDYRQGMANAYAPTPEVVDMVQSVRAPQPNNPQQGWWGTVTDVLGAPRNALYNWLYD